MDNVSTLSDEYRKKAVELPGLAAAKLTNHVTVKVDTLDNLIAKQVCRPSARSMSKGSSSKF
jgi:hypothetical protein